MSGCAYADFIEQRENAWKVYYRENGQCRECQEWMTEEEVEEGETICQHCQIELSKLEEC